MNTLNKGRFFYRERDKSENFQVKEMRMICSQLDAIIENSYDGIYITDGDANTILVNKSYEEITGVKRKDMIGRNMSDIVRDGIISQSGTLLVLETKESVTILVQGFVCVRLAMDTVKTESEKGVAGVMATILAIKGAAWGLAVGIILHVLLIASKKGKDIASTEVEV